MFKFIKQNALILAVIAFAFFLRIYQVDKLPPGLYDDEAAQGHNAYSILTTGRDEYGEFLPFGFKSFGDYKLPGYIYTDIPFIAIFGKNELGTRFPSVLFGALTTLFLYLFLKELLLLENKELQEKFRNIPIISAFVAAILPWHIQFSRGAYESVVATCLFLIGSWQFIVFIKNKKIPYLALSILFFTLASYTYNSFRILTPITLFCVFLFLIIKKYVDKKYIILLTIYTIVINLPLLIFTLGNHGSARFFQTNTFSPESLYGLTNSYIPQFFAYPFIYIKNFISYFSLQELFTKADDNVRFYSSSEFGFLFRWQLPFLIIGLFTLLKERSRIIKKVIIGMSLITPAATSITISPNALRALLLVVPFSIVTAIGMTSIIRCKKLWFKGLLLIIILFGIFESALYFHMYLSHYKNTHIIFWGGAQKKIVQEATKYSKTYDRIVINEDMFQNEKIHFLFYNNELKPLFVDSSWQKPKTWTEPILYIRYPLEIGSNSQMKLLETVTLDTPLKQSVAQLIEL